MNGFQRLLLVSVATLLPHLQIVAHSETPASLNDHSSAVQLSVQMAQRSVELLGSAERLLQLDPNLYVQEHEKVETARRTSGLPFVSMCAYTPESVVRNAISKAESKSPVETKKQLYLAIEFWSEMRRSIVNASQRYLALDDRATLLLAASLDQEVRRRVDDAHEYSSQHPEQAHNEIFSAMRMAMMCVTDRVGTEVLRDFLGRNGWPGRAVSSELDEAAWNILLHSIQDPGFQQRSLQRVERLVSTRQTNVENFAKLTDRLLVMRGSPQLYGTQYTCVDGAYVLDAVDDRDAVATRRAQLGLEPLRKDLGPCSD